MSHTKYLSDFIKVCSVLPGLMIMPAMAAEYTVKAGDSLVVTEGHSNVESGGVFLNYGSLTIGDGLVFENNSTGSSTTKEYTSVIHMRNGAETIIGDNVVFSGGSSLYDGSLGGEPGMGGTIFSWAGNKDKVNVIEIGDNVAFRDNVAVEGSVIYTYGYNEITIGDNLVMENNHAMAGDGGGGAIVINGYNGQDGSYFANTLTVGKNALFQNNTTALRAGALYVGGDKNSKAIFDDGARFIGNASSYGGAVSGFGLFEFGDVSFDSNISWNANEHVIKGWEENEDLRSEYVGYAANYVGNGGAVLNRGEFVINGNANFVNNYAEGLGGAIYNKGGNVIFNGDVVFSGNKDGVTVEIVEDAKSLNGFVLGAVSGGTPNDIYNEGTLTIAAGTTTLDGGITGTGIVNVANGAMLDIKTTTVEQESINLNESGVLAMSLLTPDNYARVNAELVGGSIKLNIGSAGKYDVFASGYDGDVEAGSVFDVEVKDNFVVATTKNAHDVAKEAGITAETANTLVALANHDSSAMQLVSLAAQQDLNAGNKEAVARELAKLTPEVAPMAQSTAISTQSQIGNLVSNRLGGGMTGHNGGDLVYEYGAWAQGLINKSKYANHFDGTTHGVSVGFDAQVNTEYVFGIGYAFNHSDIDVANRDTEIDSNSVFVYGQYKPTQAWISGTVSFTLADYTENTNVYGLPFETEYSTEAFGINSTVGYDYDNGVTPEAGMRYLHVSTEAYDNEYGNVSAQDTDFLSVMGGVKYAFQIESDGAWKFSPTLRAAATYDLISDAAVATITVPGTVPYVVTSDKLSRFGTEFGIGLTAQYQGLAISLNYELDLHEDYTSQTGLLKFRYDF